MRVMERLQHGFTAAIVVAILAAYPQFALGQIIKASEPYQAAGQSAQPMQKSATELNDKDLAMLGARQAIAYGDIQAAEKYVQQAQTNTALNSQTGDTIESISSLITSQKNLVQLSTQRDPDYNAKAANFLIQQAASILKYQDFDTAEMLLAQAKKFPVDLAKLPVSPDSIMNLIAQSKSKTVENSQGDVAQLLSIMSQAQLEFDKGEFASASALVAQAKSLNVSDTAVPVNQILPWQLELKIQQATGSQGEVVAASFENNNNEPIVQAAYDPNLDTTRNVGASATMPAHSEPNNNKNAVAEFSPMPNQGMRYYELGMVALKGGDIGGARNLFEMAWEYRQQFDEATQQIIQDQLTNLPSGGSNTNAEEFPFPTNDTPANNTAPVQNVFGGNDSFQSSPVQSSPVQSSPVESAPMTTEQNESEFLSGIDERKETIRMMQREVFRQRASAEKMREDNPRAAIEVLTQLRDRVNQSEIADTEKKPFFTIIDRDIAEFQAYITRNISKIQLDEDNAAALADVRGRREKKYAAEQQLQKLVEDFNDLMDEERFAEASAIVRQAEDLLPDSEVVALLKSKSRIAMNVAEGEAIRREKEDNFVRRLNDVDRDTINNVSEDIPIIFGELDRWERTSRLRSEWLTNQRYSDPSERRIWNLLKNEQVQGHYQGTLSDAIDQLSEQVGVNILIDKIALNADTISADTGVDVRIRQPISLESALNVVLGNAGLVFVVEDEVIKVTSRDAQRKDVKPRTYYVGDLVTPIQNFRNSLSMNFMTPNGATGSNGIIGQSVPLANHSSTSISPIELAQQVSNSNYNPNALAQQLPGGFAGTGALLGGGGPVQSGTPTYSSVGPQALGGVTQADFQPLMNLIRNTISPDDWQDTNGDGTLQAFVPNLSLIVSQTQEVQDQIQDLLTQLRELNDVQIVVEVRFVSLSDSFFERIGIDFDFNLNDNSNLNPAALPDEVSGSSVIGLQTGTSDAGPTFSGDLDIPFQQTNFLSTIPAFGGFDPGTAASFGFAILSDIEVFFLIQASKGDTRSNITQAPTVTMFNGQVANVNDGAQVPFVTSVTPVVGDFAVAQQPIITLLPEGASLNVQAVVSNDRKSVRLTLVPFFSEIRDVDTFTFDGSVTTQRATDDTLIDDLLGAVTGVDPDPDANTTELSTATEGVTIQLPTLGFTSVSTVVSVPDGGTVLLGGVKRQQEQRVERGVPFLSNIPYVSRLFKNVGIGRETSSLMLMVTPRIIIQEEEELEQTGVSRN